MYKLFGWINVCIAAMMIMYQIFAFINRRYIKNEAITKQLNTYRFMHKVFGGLLIAGTIVHAVLALGAWSFNAGMLSGIAAVLAVLAAIGFYAAKKKALFIIHRVFAAAFVVLMLVHLIFRI